MSKPNPQLKPKRGLGSVVTRQRRKVIDIIDKERTNRIQNARQRAAYDLTRAARHENNALVRQRDAWRSAFLGSIANQQTAVLRSYGMTHPVRATTRDNWQRGGVYNPDANPLNIAYTDFERVVIEWWSDGIPDRSDDYTHIIDTVASMRAVFQHEFGHLLYTTPYPVLYQEASAHMFLPPMPQLQWAWNALEDQRMESLAVRAVPRLATYFTSMILKIILDEDSPESSWLLLAGRTYLPDEVRYYSRDAFANRALADEWYDIVKSYKTATNAVDMMQAVIRAKQFMDANQFANTPNGTTHRDPSAGASTDPSTIGNGGDELQQEKDSLDEFTPTNNAPKSDKNEQHTDTSPNGSGDNGGDDVGEGDGDEGDGDGDGDDGDGAGGTGGTGGDDESESTDMSGSGSQGKTEPKVNNHEPTAHVPSVMESGHTPSNSQSGESGDGNFKHSVEQQLEQVLNELRNDNDVIAAARNINIDFEHSHIPTLSTSDMPMLSDDNQRIATMLSGGIETALSDYVTASQPHWVDRVDHGIISPLAFRTKDIGSYDYRRDRVGECVDGLDLHVSFLSDVSVSMEGSPMTALSIAMYAMVSACQRLGIGTTCTLWSSPNETYRIWDNEEPAPILMGALGGTDPVSALDDLVTHNPEDASQHLVFIFTDGEWGGYVPALSDTYGGPNRRIVVVRYGMWYANEVVAIDESYGSDALININDITKMPEVLQNCISDMLSSAVTPY